SRCAPRRPRSTSRRSRAPRAEAATGRPPAARATGRWTSCWRRSPPRSRPTWMDNGAPPLEAQPPATPGLAGVWLVDKPVGPTSHDVVASVRRRLGRRVRVGHAGTLDPFATGLLVVLPGRATRLAPYLSDL